MSEDIRYELPDPAMAAHTWLLQDEHLPASRPPLLQGGSGFGFGPPPPPGTPPVRVDINGYAYVRADALRGSIFGRIEAPATVAEARRWRKEWLPEVDAVIDLFDRFDPTAVGAGDWQRTLAEQDQAFLRVMAGIHRTAVGPMHLAVNRFLDAYVARFGEARRADGLALLQGFPNRSLDRTVALWELSRQVRNSAGLQAALAGGEIPAGEAAVATAFRAGLAATLEAFGSTSNNGLQDLPTWQEDPAIPLALIRAYATQEDSQSPVEAARRQAERRQTLEVELRARAAEEPEIAALLPLLEIAQQLVPNVEDHNLLADQRLAAAARRRWLAIGRLLVARGAVEDASDIFYYYRHELEAVLEGAPPLPAAALAERRRRQAAYRAAPPPAVLGRPDEEPAARLPEEPAAGLTLRGLPAAPGSYRAQARVVESLEAAGRLVQGEILVCRSTTPPWTPLFAIAGALVTGAGGPLSHSAIMAREFGIPAVLSVRNVTRRIPDGATVTVDGTTGVVLVEG